MSSFIVKPETINRIVSFLDATCGSGSIWASTYKDLLRKYELDNIDTGTRILIMDSSEWGNRITQKLYELNIEATGQRYPGESLEELPGLNVKPKVIRYHFMPASIVQVYKSLQCLRYQCSEGDVPERPLYKFLEELGDTLAREIIDSLTEYTNAEWD